MPTTGELIALAKQTAAAYQLDPALVCSVVEQESAFNPYAIRFEPAFYEKYEKSLTTISDTERHSRAFSWGLMQCMGQTAREFGFKAEFLSMLTNPYPALDIGCRILKSKLATHPNDLEAGLLAYNGGKNLNYPKEVLARMPHYQ